MKDIDKTKFQLIEELEELRSQISLVRNKPKLKKQVSEDLTALPNLDANNIGLQDILDAFPFYVMILNKNHDILIANKAVETDLKIPPTKLIGGYCPKLIHNSDGPVHECPLEKSVESKKSAEQEFFDPEYNNWVLSAVYPSKAKINEQDIYVHMTYDITKWKNTENDLIDSYSKLKRLTEAVTQALVRIIEKRDPYTAGHLLNASKLAYQIGKEMDLQTNELEAVRIAGLLHDIGKISIPIEILCKPGKLNDLEYNIIKNHALIGYEILKDIEFPGDVSQVVLQHHERINGSGYPNGLADNDINIGAKILSVADVVEAMHSHRPYRPAFGIEAALAEIIKNRAILYDPLVVDSCLKIFRENKFIFI